MDLRRMFQASGRRKPTGNRFSVSGPRAYAQWSQSCRFSWASRWP